MKLIFFGRPGSGKGTYASRICPQLGIVHIATGDMYRSEVANGTKLGKLANSYMQKGQLVPDDVTIRMFKKRLEKAKKGFILDGFPRTMEQAGWLEKMTSINLVVNFVIDEEIIIEKALARRVCENCGNIYNIADIRRDKIRLPPLLPKKDGICDKCGGHLYQREDDNYETIKDRQDTYVKQSAPLLEYYRSKNMVRDVDVIGGPEMMVPIIINVIKKNVTNLKKILLDTNIYGWAVEDKYVLNLLNKFIKGKKHTPQTIIIFGFDTVMKELKNNPHKPTKVRTLSLYKSAVSEKLKGNKEVQDLADAYFAACKNSKIKITIEDCEIVAASTLNSIDFIVTNNRRTLNNPGTLKIVEKINSDQFKTPKIIDSKEAIAMFSS